MATNLTIRLISNIQRDQILLKSLLTVVGRRRAIEWTYLLYDNNCDVVIVDADAPHPSIATLKKLYGAKFIVVYAASPYKMPMADFILTKPLRAKDLNYLLTEIEKGLGFESSGMAGNNTLDKLDALSLPSINNVQAKAVVQAVAINENVISKGLIDDLLILIKKYKDSVLELSIDNITTLYIDNYKKRVLVDKALFNNNYTGKMTLKIIESLPKREGLVLMTFTDLFYELTLTQLNPALVSGLSAESIYYIKQWPNMGNSRHAKNMVRIAAYFSKQQATLSKAAYDLSIELNQIIGFINAVYSQNLLMYLANTPSPQKIVPDLMPKEIEQPKSNASSQPKAKSNAVGGLFSRIRQRLGI